MNKLFLISGLPRSGKSLLNDILNQNKNLFSLSHSPICEMLWRQYDLWNDNHEFTKYDLSKVKDLKSKYLKEFIFNFYKNLTDKKILFDTKLSWSNINNIKMYRDIFNDKPKIIACVRNVEDIMASYYSSRYKDRFCIVEYNKLIKEPEKTLEKIYKFIEEPKFKHNFKKLKLSKTDVTKVLTKNQLSHYTKMSFWRGYSYR